MGTWGHQTFANDGASDWVWTLKKEGLRSVERAIAAALKNREALEAPECENAAAAAESLCVLLGKPGASTPKEVSEWVSGEKMRPSPRLIKDAVQAVEAILAKSELKDLWDESDESAAWRSEMESIRDRLSSAGKSGGGAGRPWWKPW
jgi:hypothetical protein